MSTYTVSLVEAIKTKLDTVTGLKAVYTHSGFTYTAGYPIAIIHEGGFDNLPEDQTFVRRLYHIVIDVMQEISEEGFKSAKAARVFREIQDEIISVLDADITLGGTTLMTLPVKVEEPMIEDYPVTHLRVRMQVDCHVEIQRTPGP